MASALSTTMLRTEGGEEVYVLSRLHGSSMRLIDKYSRKCRTQRGERIRERRWCSHKQRALVSNRCKRDRAEIYIEEEPLFV